MICSHVNCADGPAVLCTRSSTGTDRNGTDRRSCCSISVLSCNPAVHAAHVGAEADAPTQIVANSPVGVASFGFAPPRCGLRAGSCINQSAIADRSLTPAYIPGG